MRKKKEYGAGRKEEKNKRFKINKEEEKKYQDEHSLSLILLNVIKERRMNLSTDLEGRKMSLASLLPSFSGHV